MLIEFPSTGSHLIGRAFEQGPFFDYLNPPYVRWPAPALLSGHGLVAISSPAGRRHATQIVSVER